jgi:hypothetical protein
LLEVNNSVALLLSQNENTLIPLVAEMGRACSQIILVTLGDVIGNNMRELNNIMELMD